jgi:hypothetical protein
VIFCVCLAFVKSSPESRTLNIEIFSSLENGSAFSETKGFESFFDIIIEYVDPLTLWLSDSLGYELVVEKW